MRAELTDKDALCAIPPTALRGYLEFEGWNKTHAFGRFGQIYRIEGDDGAAEIAVPFTTDIADYAAAVLHIIEVLSRREDRDQIAIYRDLVGSDREVVRVRAPKADEDGSVEVQEGVDLVLNARDLMASAACSAHDPRAAYHLGKVQAANDYMKKVRLGQTEQGSYVVTLLAPVPPLLQARQISLWPEFDEEPYERQVTRTLANGLQAAQEAVLAVNRGDDGDPFGNAVIAGVSANMCEALSNLIDRGAGIDVSITWARTRPTPESRSKISFSQSSGEVLREAARVLRQREPRRDERILGYVVGLGREHEQDDGKVTIRALVDGKSRSMKADLNATDYATAYEAHGRRLPVTLTADIDTRMRPWSLSQLRDLHLIEDERDDPGSV